MKERPILFSTPMVQAILEGRKIQTRRIMKPQINIVGKATHGQSVFTPSGDIEIRGWAPDGQYGAWFRKPYCKKGDELWVRETWLFNPDSTEFRYKASFNSEDEKNRQARLNDGWDWPKWKPSIFMSKDACRLRLKVIEVRVERLNEISEEDSIYEGVERNFDDLFQEMRYRDYLTNDPVGWRSPKSCFETLWDSINGEPRKDGQDISWSANPWVWVIEFEKL